MTTIRTKPLRARVVYTLLAIGHTLFAAAPLAIGQTQSPKGWEVLGVPAVNYNPDDKFGYGAVLQIFNYGTAGKLPYSLTIQPTIYLSTGGRRDYTVFVDAPNIGGGAWRVDAYFGHETQKAASYFGVGNKSVYDESLEEDPNEKYYKFGRERVQFMTNVQRRIGDTRWRVLAGLGASRGRVDETADGAPTTLLSQELAGADPPEGWSNFVRAGAVYDSRDREVHTTHGTWADFLVQRVDEKLGSDWSYTRATLTLRRYTALSPTLTLAQRAILQGVSGDVPFYDMTVVQTSFKPQEGLGGAQTLRGFTRGRFLGKSLAASNTELRWRARELTVLGAPSSITMVGFFDAGRVWAGDIDLSDVTRGIHVGYGGGVRLGRGPNFVVSIDAGRSRESTMSLYLGMGFLF
ncbi:MAG TPA: BamA/TamA family outer membrane protein [Gemmatimonadaceae bacterium]|nr:BamA/TamA family outer membrane protein [Gemmatimonadaceae bacterium]